MLIRFLLLLFLSSCAPPGPASPYHLHLKLPPTLGRGSVRYERFLARVVSLDIEIENRVGERAIYHFPPNQWESIFLDLSRLDLAEGFRLKASVWDRHKNGHLRETPLLQGQKEFSGKALETKKLSIRLVAQVSLRGYR